MPSKAAIPNNGRWVDRVFLMRYLHSMVLRFEVALREIRGIFHLPDLDLTQRVRAIRNGDTFSEKGSIHSNQVLDGLLRT